ncbi:MAG: hypothetical protein ACLVHE_00970 [Dialister invisus]
MLLKAVIDKDSGEDFRRGTFSVPESYEIINMVKLGRWIMI